MSTIYYAVFHTLAKECADTLVGSAGSQRSRKAWNQVYRSLEHGPCSNACKNKSILNSFPKEIENLGRFFIVLQEKRHRADYDPQYNITKSEVQSDLEQTSLIIKSFKKTPIKDRRAFCAYILFRQRN